VVTRKRNRHYDADVDEGVVGEGELVESSGEPYEYLQKSGEKTRKKGGGGEGKREKEKETTTMMPMSMR